MVPRTGRLEERCGLSSGARLVDTSSSLGGCFDVRTFLEADLRFPGVVRVKKRQISL